MSYSLGDDAVRATNDDATACKRCAVQLGYWKDPYISLFISSHERKAPEINRGYYARTKGMKILTDNFLQKTKGHCQVINVGAGYDTLYWRLKDEGHNIMNFIELDFAGVTSRKCYFIKRCQALLQKVHTEDGEVRFSSSDLHASNYHIVAADLRNIEEVETKLLESDVDYSLPTLVISECVLVYMESTQASRLLKWIAEKFPTSCSLNYEQVNMQDRFGEVMMNNLKERGCSLAGVDACKSLETQKNRYLGTGWAGAKAWDMTTVYALLPGADIHRVESLEFLDEQELLQQLFQHYCICVGWNDKENLGLCELDFR